MIWRCKDGREIPMGSLEDNHLMNILRMLKRDAENTFADCGNKYFTSWRQAAFWQFEYLEAEAERRGLSWSEAPQTWWQKVKALFGRMRQRWST
jgi:hypothetical protein